MLDRADRPAVRERLVHGEVEALLPSLHPGAVERAVPVAQRGAPARGTLPGLVVGTLLEEQEIDAPVGRSLERAGPAGHRAPAAPGLLAPALEQLDLALPAPALEHRRRELEQLRRADVCLGVDPAGQRRPRLLRELLADLRPHVLGTCNHDRGRVQLADVPVQLLDDLPDMLGGEPVDMPLHARLRPAALVVPPRLLLGAVDDLVQLARAEPVDLAALAPDDGDQS